MGRRADETARRKKEEEWDFNEDQQYLRAQEMARSPNATKQDINNLFNFYLDRYYGLVENPHMYKGKPPRGIDDYFDKYTTGYEMPLEYYDLMDSLPWKQKPVPFFKRLMNFKKKEAVIPPDDLESHVIDNEKYVDRSNRQELFDKFYPHLQLADSAPSSKPNNVLKKKGSTSLNKFEKVAKFGESMGKEAFIAWGGGSVGLHRQTRKAAAFRGVSSVPAGAGPQQIANALNMYNQAKALVDPSAALKREGISKKNFNSMIGSLAKRQGDSYELSEMKQNPKTRSAILGILGALGGGLAGKLTGQGLGSSLGLAAAGGLTGAGTGYIGAGMHNKNLLATAKVLKDYGLLKPDQLRSALPLLAS